MNERLGDGFYRGTACGKPWLDVRPTYTCAMCGRPAEVREELCFPLHFKKKKKLLHE